MSHASHPHGRRKRPRPTSTPLPPLRRATRHSDDAFGVGIDVHRVVAEEADKGYAATVGEFDGEAGGGGDGPDAGDTRQ